MWQIIISYICQLITTLGFFIFTKIVVNEKIKISKKQVILSFILVSIINTIVYLEIYGTLKSVLMAIVNVLYCGHIYKISYKKSIFTTFIYMIILFIMEIFQLFFITEILNETKEFGYNAYGGTIISNIISFIIVILITYCLKKILRKILNIKLENNKKIIIFSSLIAICIIMFFYTIIQEFEFNEEVVLYLIAITVLLVVLFSLIKQTIQNNKLTKEYDNLLEFMTTYENEIENQRTIRHETQNEFLTIKAKINDKQNNQEIIKYIDNILNEKIIVKQEECAKFGYLPPNGIKGLCYLKIQEAQNKGLKTKINISKRIKNSNIYELNIKEQRDLAKILGVFLDNAIEASIKSKNKIIGIESYLNISKECQIIISNSYDGKLEIDKIGKEKFSTKGKNRGHGLLLVKQITSKNDKFEIKTDITNELYIQTIIIKNNNKKV